MNWRYAVYLVNKQGMNSASSPYYYYISTSELDVLAHIDTRGYPLSRHCRALVKDLQTGEKYYYAGLQAIQPQTGNVWHPIRRRF